MAQPLQFNIVPSATVPTSCPDCSASSEKAESWKRQARQERRINDEMRGQGELFLSRRYVVKLLELVKLVEYGHTRHEKVGCCICESLVELRELEQPEI